MRTGGITFTSAGEDLVDKADEGSATHIFVARRVPHQILHNVLRCACSNSSSSSRSSHWQLRHFALARVHTVLLTLPLRSPGNLPVPEHRQRMRRDDGRRSQSVRHILDGGFARWALVKEQLRTVDGGVRRVEYTDLSTREPSNDLCQ